MDFLLILSLALAIDLALGELPQAIHPVVWMGKVTSWLERVSVGHRPSAQFFYGVVISLLSVGLFAIPTYFTLYYLKGLSYVGYVVVGAMLLKSTFSLRELRKAALRVKGLLLNERVDKACLELNSLVSRDTKGLPESMVVSATVESVAENLSDSFVAPLFYFLLFGVPGAMAYRVVNTQDAIIGYHGKYEYLGKFASWLDDVLNFIPARLTALLLVLAVFLSKGSLRISWQTVLSEHAKTESPNAGWPMAAMAGGLGVPLEKLGHYRLEGGSAPLVPGTIDAALKLMLVSALSWVLICLIVGVIYFVLEA